MAEKIENGFLTVQENDATTEIRSSLLTYGSDVLRTKFPSYVDGLKDITRRIVWFSRDKRELQGLGKAMGEVCEYHVSGDSSVYEAFVRLAQPFMMGHPLITMQGNIGNHYNPNGASQVRYLEAQLSEFARDVFISGTHPRTIPMVVTKTFGEMEPRYLIPKLPTALFFGNLTVGFGFKSHYPMLDFANVCDAVMHFSEFYQKGGVGIPNYRNLAKYLTPVFPIPTTVRNRPELITKYAVGEFSEPLEVEGIVDVSGNAIILRSVPYGVDFSKIVKTIRDLMCDKKHWLWNYLVTVNDYSTDVAEFSMELKRGVNPYMVLDLLRPLMKFNDRWHPIYSYMKDDRAVTLNPVTLIYLWYQERAICIAGGLKYRQADLIQSKMMLEAMLVICEHANEVIELIRESEDEADAIERLFKRFENLTWKQAKIIAQQRISTLAKANRNQISMNLEKTMQDIDSTIASFSKIHETIHSDASFLKKKYGSVAVTRFAENYLGYVQFGSFGITHFFTEDEMYDILNTKGWPGSIQRTIHFYDSKTPIRYLVKSGKFVPMLIPSREITCEGVVCYPSERADLTLAIDPSGYTVITDRVIDGVNGDYTICPITKNFIGIHRNGTVKAVNVADFSNRKTVCRGAKSDLIYGLPEKVKDAVIFHMNTSETNVLRVDRIVSGETFENCKTVPIGKTVILSIVPVKTENLYLNIPDSCRKNVAIEHIKIPSVSRLLSKGQLHLFLNIGKTNTGVKLKRNNVVKTLFTLDTTDK